MNKMTLDQNEEELFSYEVSDEVLEVAGCAGTAKANTACQQTRADGLGHDDQGAHATKNPSRWRRKRDRAGHPA
jgi:hypothetical protein